MHSQLLVSMFKATRPIRRTSANINGVAVWVHPEMPEYGTTISGRIVDLRLQVTVPEEVDHDLRTYVYIRRHNSAAPEKYAAHAFMVECLRPCLSEALQQH